MCTGAESKMRKRSTMTCLSGKCDWVLYLCVWWWCFSLVPLHRILRCTACPSLWLNVIYAWCSVDVKPFIPCYKTKKISFVLVLCIAKWQSFGEFVIRQFLHWPTGEVEALNEPTGSTTLSIRCHCFSDDFFSPSLTLSPSGPSFSVFPFSSLH